MIGFTIKDVTAREIIDSRGNPTLEAQMTLEGDITEYASVPSGISVGLFEALELRDCDDNRYNGMGVLKAINIIEEIIKPELVKKKFHSLREFDEYIIKIDGTNNKSRIGSNTSLALSLAFTKCVAKAKNIQMFEVVADEYQNSLNYKAPIPMLNIINGGRHANNDLMIQEFMIVPIMDENTSIQDRIRLSCEFFADLRNILQAGGSSTNVGDEGGFAPMVNSPNEALDMMMDVMMKNKYKNIFKVAIDAAASTFYDDTTKLYTLDRTLSPISSSEMVQYYSKLIDQYPIISIEDPMAEDDIEGWQEITQKLGNKVMLVGDDIFVTNTINLQIGIENKIANAILIKPNQIGTITETIGAVKLAKANNYDVIVSHRSGETEDVSLAHIALGLGASYIKAGAPCRSERVAKYNELMRIC
jgi:enolase